MKEFLLLLFFKQTILLTPYPIDLTPGVAFEVTTPVKAVTSGAFIYIPVPYAQLTNEDIPSYFQRLKQTYPPHSIEGVLIPEKGDPVKLSYTSNMFTHKEAWLVLNNPNGVPTGITYKEIALKSKIPLQGVQIYWSNAQK